MKQTNSDTKTIKNTNVHYLAKRDLRKVYKIARDAILNPDLSGPDRASFGRLLLDIAMAGEEQQTMTDSA